MGAYENPPPINFRTTSAGAAWANAAAGIGKNIGNAIIERRKYLDEKLEKENKEMLDLTRRRNALTAQGAEKLKANLEKMPGLDEEFKKAYIKEFNQGWQVYTRAQTSTDLDEIESLQPQLKRFNHFKAVSEDQIKNANDYSIKMATFIDQIVKDGPGVPNTVDLYYAGNNNLMKAANIETGGITEGESREVIVNDKGDAVMRYTFVNENGKSETFDLNTSELDLDNVLQVPDFNNKVEGTVTNTGIFNEDGSINPSYAPLDENNQPKLETTTEIVDGKRIITTNQVVNTEGIIQQYTDAGMNAMQDMSHAQKVSIWKNTIAPALDPKKDYNEDGEPDGFLPENLAYDSETGQFTDAQQKIFDAGVSAYLGDMARMKVEAATKDNYKRTIVNEPTKTLSNSYKNTRAAFKRMQDGEDANLALTTNTYIAKDDSGKWNVFTIGNLGVPMARFTTTVDGEQVASGVDNVIDLVTLIPGVDHEKLKRDLSGTNNQSDPLNPN